MKNIRDGGLQVSVQLIIISAAMYFHVSTDVAMAIMVVGAAAAPFVYRTVRHFWPWLYEADPPA